MSLTPITVGENPQVPSATAYSFVPDQLVAGEQKIVSQPIVLSAGTLPRGSVLGQVTSSSVIAVAGNNTGNGTVGSLSAETGSKVGAYKLLATSPTEFSVTDPEGNVLAAATVGTAYSESGLGFTITAGDTAFVAGDSFTLSVPDSIGNFVLSVKTATDGSQVPTAVLSDYADASTGPVEAGAYLTGEFNGNRMNFDASWSIATLATAMRPYGIFVKDSVSAADPT